MEIQVTGALIHFPFIIVDPALESVPPTKIDNNLTAFVQTLYTPSYMYFTAYFP